MWVSNQETHPCLWIFQKQNLRLCSTIKSRYKTRTTRTGHLGVSKEELDDFYQQPDQNTLPVAASLEVTEEELEALFRKWKGSP